LTCINAELVKIYLLGNLPGLFTKGVFDFQFGCYLILHSIKQAEKIFSAFVELSEELKQSW